MFILLAAPSAAAVPAAAACDFAGFSDGNGAGLYFWINCLSMKTVVVGLLGSVLDAPSGPNRWSRWRPTVAACQHDDLVIARFDLIHEPAHIDLAHLVRDDIRQVSPETEVRLHSLRFADPWDFQEVYGVLHDFARTYPWKPERERYLVHLTTGTHVAQICWFLLTESRHVPASILQTAPPRKGESGYTVVDLDLSKYDRLAARFLREQREGLSFLKAGIDTRNPAFNRTIAEIERVAVASQAPLLLMGPTGAGKSQLARRIYELKRARGQVVGPLVEVNCATIRGDGAMSALFGHEKGAFTGAVRDRPGLLRKADGGLLFLDEIGELGLDEQAMLLGAIEDKSFLPVGADGEVESDFQLIAGTNRDLAARDFREDLLARINLWTYRLPPLSERPEDIEPNLDWELDRLTQQQRLRITFSREARARFVAFAVSREARWTGNFRDFNAALTRMATLAPGGRIDVDTVEDEVSRLRAAWSGEGDLVDKLLGKKEIDRFERVQLAEVLAVCRGAISLSAAGRTLFASSLAKRSSANDADRLRKYLARHGLDWNRVRNA
jgi:transcriptional regulatory protein RtcR